MDAGSTRINRTILYTRGSAKRSSLYMITILSTETESIVHSPLAEGVEI